MSKKLRKSMTLMEMITAIVVFSVAVPTLVMLFSQATFKTVEVGSVSDATFYAQTLMEEIRAKAFDENDVSPWSATLGPDTSTMGVDGVTPEDIINHSNWDDIDDYNGYSDTPDPKYTREVTVTYYTLTSGVWEPASSTPTDIKHIVVTVARVDASIAPVRLVLQVAGRELN